MQQKTITIMITVLMTQITKHIFWIPLRRSQFKFFHDEYNQLDFFVRKCLLVENLKTYSCMPYTNKKLSKQTRQIPLLGFNFNFEKWQNFNRRCEQLRLVL